MLADVIEDFFRNEGDKIDLSAIDANGAGSGSPAFVFRGASQFSAAGQVRYYQKDFSTMIEVSTDADKLPEMIIEIFTPLDLITSDFRL